MLLGDVSECRLTSMHERIMALDLRCAMTIGLFYQVSFLMYKRVLAGHVKKHSSLSVAYVLLMYVNLQQ